MLLQILTHPFMFGVVYPILALAIIAGLFELTRPEKDEPAWTYGDYTTQEIKPRDNVYKSENAINTRAERYDWEQSYDSFPVKDPGTPMHDEFERRMVARLIAHNFLYELGVSARQTASC